MMNNSQDDPTRHQAPSNAKSGLLEAYLVTLQHLPKILVTFAIIMVLASNANRITEIEISFTNFRLKLAELGEKVVENRITKLKTKSDQNYEDTERLKALKVGLEKLKTRIARLTQGLPDDQAVTNRE